MASSKGCQLPGSTFTPPTKTEHLVPFSSYAATLATWELCGDDRQRSPLRIFRDRSEERSHLKSLGDAEAL